MYFYMAMENKPYVIGLDLGGTNSVFGIVNSEGSGDFDVYPDERTERFGCLYGQCLCRFGSDDRTGGRHPEYQGDGNRCA